VRVTWVQPEDVLPHELVASREEGVLVDDIEARWLAAADPLSSVGGASAPPARPPALLAEELDESSGGRCRQRRRARRSGLDPGHVAHLCPRVPAADRTACTARGSAGPRLGVGKPVEKVPRAGIREIPYRPLAAERLFHGRRTSTTWPRAGRGTRPAVRPASSRTSTGCPKTTT
jgi:hypothetical protein